MSSYSDGDFTVAAASSGKEKTFPFSFEGDNTSFYTEQNFIQARASFAPTALNSKDPDDSSSYLVGESPLRDLGGDLVEWTRTYSRIPAKRNSYESFAYTFPGFAATFSSRLTTPWALPSGTFSALDDPGRQPLTKKVTSRLHHNFFLVGTNGSYSDPDLIPIIPAQRYTYGSYFAAGNPGWVNLLNDLPDKILWPNSGYPDGTSPTVEQYKAMVAAGAEIVAEDSIVRHWKGKIYERITRYVRAQ